MHTLFTHDEITEAERVAPRRPARPNPDREQLKADIQALLGRYYPSWAPIGRIMRDLPDRGHLWPASSVSMILETWRGDDVVHRKVVAKEFFVGRGQRVRGDVRYYRRVPRRAREVTQHSALPLDERNRKRLALLANVVASHGQPMTVRQIEQRCAMSRRTIARALKWDQQENPRPVFEIEEGAAKTKGGRRAILWWPRNRKRKL